MTSGSCSGKHFTQARGVQLRKHSWSVTGKPLPLKTPQTDAWSSILGNLDAVERNAEKGNAIPLIHQQQPEFQIRAAAFVQRDLVAQI